VALKMKGEDGSRDAKSKTEITTIFIVGSQSSVSAEIFCYRPSTVKKQNFNGLFKRFCFVCSIREKHPSLTDL